MRASLLIAVLWMGCGFRISSVGLDAAAGDDADPIDAIDAKIEDGPGDDTDGDGVLDVDDNCALAKNSAQEDFDGDAVGDVCDLCPHLAAASEPDGDGDGIGDRCDPRPQIAGDVRVHWLPFFDASDIATWRHSNNMGVWSVTGSRLVQTDPAPSLTLLDSPTDFGDLYWAAEIEVTTALAGNDEVGVCGGDIPVGTQYYCCAINPGAVRTANFWAGAVTQRSQSVTWTGSLAVGARVNIVGRMDDTETNCTFTQGGFAASVNGQRGPQTPGSAVMYTAFMPAAFRYLFVVAIGN